MALVIVGETGTSGVPGLFGESVVPSSLLQAEKAMAAVKSSIKIVLVLVFILIDL